MKQRLDVFSRFVGWNKWKKTYLNKFPSPFYFSKISSVLSRTSKQLSENIISHVYWEIITVFPNIEIYHSCVFTDKSWKYDIVLSILGPSFESSEFVWLRTYRDNYDSDIIWFFIYTFFIPKKNPDEFFQQKVIKLFRPKQRSKPTWRKILEE